MSKFKDKARQFLKEHESNLALQRLRRNQPLTPSDLEEPQGMLVEACGTQELINEAKEKNHGLGFFIRSLVGLDHEVAAAEFSRHAKPNLVHRPGCPRTDAERGDGGRTVIPIAVHRCQCAGAARAGDGNADCAGARGDSRKRGLAMNHRINPSY
jgi:type I site-specific restriction endonuclease